MSCFSRIDIPCAVVGWFIPTLRPVDLFPGYIFCQRFERMHAVVSDPVCKSAMFDVRRLLVSGVSGRQVAEP
jgi:hypothetical protein